MSKTPPLPIGKKENLVLKQAEIPEHLWSAVKQEMQRQGNPSFKQVMIWCMEAYLLKCNPHEAKKLGIKPE